MLILADPAFANRAANPYNALLYQALRERGVQVAEARWWAPARGARIWHLHWPEAFLSHPRALGCVKELVLLLARLLRIRLQGLRLVWTVHNLHPHEIRRPRLTAWFYRHFPACCDGLVFLSEATREAALTAHPALRGKPSVVIAHGHYRSVYPAPPTRREARAALGIGEDEKVLLFFGLVRPYKNVPRLIECFRRATLGPARLIVAGRLLDPALRPVLLAAADGDPRIRLDLQAQDEPALQRYFAAADAVALPFLEIANSGSALLALSLDRPVLAPARGSLVGLSAAVGADWLRLYEGELQPAHLQSLLQTPPPAGRPDLSSLDWPRLADRTLAFYEQLLGR